MTDYDKLNLQRPQKFTRATEYIQEQINLVGDLEKKGFTYTTTDGIYFDTSKFKDYGKLAGFNTENVKEGARVEPNEEKKNPTDFALWKFTKFGERRWQEWESPWGTGFPGWHVECSAMSLAELGNTLDIHMGGEDHKMIHHPNEIAQSEGATGEQFVRNWLHVSFLKVDDTKMSKSLGNLYTVSDVESKGYSPLSLRYFYMTAHYRSPQNFTWEALKSAQSALKKLYSVVEGYQDKKGSSVNSEYLEVFLTAVNDDINMPKALAVMWDLLKSDTSESEKLATILKFDEILGLQIDDYVGLEIPIEVKNFAETRNQYRKSGIWDKADQIRRQINDKGYIVEDIGDTYKLRKKL